MAVSVAPPSPAKRQCGARSLRRPGRSRVTQSPPRRHQRSSSSWVVDVEDNNMSSSGGTQYSWVTWCRVIKPIHASASRRSCSVSVTTAPPTFNGPNMSCTDRSNSRDDRPNVRSLAVRPTISFTALMVFMTARCVSSTPLGSPVEPDVNSTYTTSSGDWVVACAAASSGRSVVRASSSRTPVTPSSGSDSAFVSCSTTVASARSRMRLRRVAGWSAPSGTHAAPAANMPSSAVSWCGPLAMRTPTISPGATPCLRNDVATRNASSRSSA